MRTPYPVASLALSALLLFAAAACGDDAGDGFGTNNSNNGDITCDPGFVAIGGSCRPVASNNGTNNGDTNNGVNNGDTNNGDTNNGQNNGVNNGDTNNGDTNNGDMNNGQEGCVQGQSRCVDTSTLERCDGGGQWQAEACPDGLLCDQGTCRQPNCQPGSVVGCQSAQEQAICNELGTGTEGRACPDGLLCRNGECTDRICDEGETRCDDAQNVLVCNPAGDGFEVQEDCTLSNQGCDDGQCRSLCEINSKVTSYLGCDYWAVDLDNVEDTGGSGIDQNSAIAVSNPDPQLTAEIVVTRVSGQEVLRFEVGPGQLEVRSLPIGQDIDNTGIFRNHAWRIDTSIPVTIHQFNPLNGDAVYTNDASLLLPTNATGPEYLVMSWKHRGAGVSQYRGYATIVAVSEGDTNVTIVPTAAVAAGGGVPALQIGQEWSTTLQQGQVLSISTAGPEGPNADLTGTIVSADQNVSVFGGHECANIPNTSTNYCDHIEQQLFPLSSWGNQFVATPFKPRNTRQQDTWVLVSGRDNNLISTDPPTLPINGLNMRRGQRVEFTTDQAFEVRGSEPLMVGQFLHGSNYTGYTADNRCGGGLLGGTGIGDPAFTLAVPVEQYREDYIVLTPSDYVDDYLNIIAPRGTSLTLDGRPVTGLQAVGRSGLEFVQLLVADGVHRLEGDQPFGLVAYGYDCDVSYAYPGGLNLGNLGR